MPADGPKNWPRLAKLTWSTCDDSNPYQRFTIETKTAGSVGLVKDESSGRCVQIPDCEPLTGGAWYPVVLDECGRTDKCGGKNQEWKTLESAASGSTPEQKILRFQSEQDPTSCLNVPGGRETVDMLQLIVWKPCDDIDNFQFNYHTAKRWILPPPGGFLTNDWIKGVQGCGTAETCCLTSDPCHFPCWERFWGTLILIYLALGMVFYVVGSVAHSVRVKGQPMPKTLAGVVHALAWQENWAALGGMVTDGVTYTKGVCGFDVTPAPAPGGTGEQLLAAAVDGVEKRSPQKERGSGGGGSGGKSGKKESKEKKEKEKKEKKGKKEEAEKRPSLAGEGEIKKETSEAAGGGGRWVHVTGD